MKAPASILVVASVVSLASLYGFAQSSPPQNPLKLPGLPAKETPGKEQGPKEGQAPGSADEPTTKQSSRIALGALVVSFLAFLASGYTAFFVQRVSARRTVMIESQKLLLEINKQFVSNPDLFSIYDDYPRPPQLVSDKAFEEKLKALGYMHLNVFEIVFAVLPWGASRKTWREYFRDCLNRCSVLPQELESNPGIYHSTLMKEYRKWRKKAAQPRSNQPLTGSAAPALATPVSGLAPNPPAPAAPFPTGPTSPSSSGDASPSINKLTDRTEGE